MTQTRAAKNARELFWERLMDVTGIESVNFENSDRPEIYVRNTDAEPTLLKTAIVDRETAGTALNEAIRIHRARGY